MADEQSPSAGLNDVVSKVTVAALSEMDTGEMETTDKAGSRPGSAKPGSRPGSAKSKASPKGSRPGSAVADKPPSVTGSRPTSRTGSKAGSRPGSASGVPASPKASRPGSAAGVPASPKGSRPGSAAGVPASPKGSRPGSAAGVPASPKGSRPGSAVKVPASPKGSRAGSQPGSKAGSRRGSSSKEADDAEGLVLTGRPATASKTQEAEDTPPRPASGRPPSVGRPASGRPRSGDRPASGRPGSGRPGSGRPASGRPASTKRPDSGRPQDGIDDPQDTGALGQTDLGESADDLYQPMGEMTDLPPQTDLALMAQDPGDGGSDDDGSDEDEELDDEDEMSDEEEESDGENEMVVLDPDHPLMQRFQRALRSHLDKQREKVTLELRELQEAVKNKGGDRENIGVELYGVQQELARHQMMLEKHHDEYSTLNQVRNQKEQTLSDVQDMYRNSQFTVNKEKKKGSELQQEVENLALRLFYMDNAKEDVRSDIAVMRRAAEKADTEVTKAETDKQKQDLFVDRLVERVDKLREEIAMYEAQMAAQSMETKATKDALSEAHMEIEAINLEKKQLFQQWNSSLIGMRRRDEAHSAMQDALHEQQQRILSLETEIEGFKKSIYKEQEQNEKLMTINSKTENDITTMKRLLQICQDRHDALKNEYATYSRMLHETEQALNRANTDKTLRMNEVNALRKQIEREYLEKVKLEDQILEMLRSQLTLDKASQYTDKLTGKMRDMTKNLDAQVAQVENQLSKDTLEISNTRMRIERLQGIMKELDEEIRQKNEIITRSDNEMVHRNAIIERKQGVIDQYNKKMEQLISSAGGVELGPLEIQINSLQKSIDAEQAEIGELQQMWLRDQSELVRLTQEKDTQIKDVENLKKQLTILSQKKLRIEGEINFQLTETSDIERNISHMQNDMLKLNTLLHKERGTEHELEQSNILLENDFIGALREAEMESIEMQEKLDSLKEEKERLLNSLVEAERQIMLWEKKTQLARETRAAVDSETGQGEIRAMKAEIHRMQVRYTQLMKQQERMIQEMEKAVSRRDTIVTRGDAQTKTNKKVLTKGTFQRQMGDLRKKIKSTIQEANQCDGEIGELRDHQQDLSQQLEERQVNVQQLQSSADTLDGDVDRLLEHKQKNLQELLNRQQRAKYYQQAKDGRYTRLCKSDSGLMTELDKQTDRMQTLGAIVDRLNQEYPHAAPALRKVTLSLQVRTGGED